MTQTLTYPVSDVTPYVNWKYFLAAWGLPPRMASAAWLHDCPACRTTWLDRWDETDRTAAEQVLHLVDDARKMLEEWDSSSFRTRARVGIYHAWSDGDDVILVDDEGCQRRICLLRQQRAERLGAPMLCLSDFIAPRHLSEDIPLRLPLDCAPDAPDYTVRCASSIGLFAATVDPQMEEYAAGDDYRHILALTLAERLVEATAERMHEEVRRRIWGYAPDEHLTPAELFAEDYHGRRPAIGYPSLPDLSLNFDISDILGMDHIGIRLTEHGMMLPRASVSGLLLAHPAVHYFSVGKPGEDQLRDYARRRGRTAESLRPFLRMQSLTSPD